MKFGVISRITGIFLMAYSLSMLPPIVVSLVYEDGGTSPFVLTMLGTLLAGLLLWFAYRHRKEDLRAREGFIIVAVFWIVLGGISSLPFHFSNNPHLSYTDAIFEAVSGLTTTGATVLTGLEDLPHSILWYRQQLQWLGGLGVVVIALAILPVLGVGGMQLYRAETTGPSKHDKLTPRLRDTVRAFFKVYLWLTVLCAGLYWSAGMNGFDAIGHALSTVSTGGFSTHDASMAYFESVTIEAIAMLFMLAGGISFGLLYVSIITRQPKLLWQNEEARAFLLTATVVTLIGSLYLLVSDHHDSTFAAFMASSFQVVSVITSTGFGTDDFSAWPGSLPVLLIFISIMGGCAGSTAGGMKVIRFQMLLKQGVREVHKLVHPSAEMPVKFGKRIVSDRIIESIWGFFAAYTLIYVILMLLLIASGLDQVTAFSAVAATLNNLGPGLGEVSSNFLAVNDFGKWVSIAAMLIGRLEIFTVLVLLTPEFWRQ